MAHMGVTQIQGYLIRGYIKDIIVFGGSILGSPYEGQLPSYIPQLDLL